MSKRTIYEKARGDWRQWDDEAYRLAVVMSKAFSVVANDPEADEGLVAELKQLNEGIENYRNWQSENKAS